MLPYRTGLHTPMFEPYLEPFVTHFADIHPQTPTVPVWSSVTAAPFPTRFPDDEPVFRELVWRFYLERVRFRELVAAPVRRRRAGLRPARLRQRHRLRRRHAPRPRVPGHRRRHRQAHRPRAAHPGRRRALGRGRRRPSRPPRARHPRSAARGAPPRRDGEARRACRCPIRLGAPLVRGALRPLDVGVGRPAGPRPATSRSPARCRPPSTPSPPPARTSSPPTRTDRPDRASSPDVAVRRVPAAAPRRNRPGHRGAHPRAPAARAVGRLGPGARRPRLLPPGRRLAVDRRHVPARPDDDDDRALPGGRRTSGARGGRRRRHRHPGAALARGRPTRSRSPSTRSARRPRPREGHDRGLHPSHRRAGRRLPRRAGRRPTARSPAPQPAEPTTPSRCTTSATCSTAPGTRASPSSPSGATTAPAPGCRRCRPRPRCSTPPARCSATGCSWRADQGPHRPPGPHRPARAVRPRPRGRHPASTAWCASLDVRPSEVDCDLEIVPPTVGSGPGSTAGPTAGSRAAAQLFEATMKPQHQLLAERRDGYWVVVEHWAAGATRDLAMRRYLGEAERARVRGDEPAGATLLAAGSHRREGRGARLAVAAGPRADLPGRGRRDQRRARASARRRSRRDLASGVVGPQADDRCRDRRRRARRRGGRHRHRADRAPERPLRRHHHDRGGAGARRTARPRPRRVGHHAAGRPRKRWGRPGAPACKGARRTWRSTDVDGDRLLVAGLGSAPGPRHTRRSARCQHRHNR